MVMSDPTTWVYQFIFYKYESKETNIIHYFVIHWLGLCIKLNSSIANILYTWPFSHNKAVPISNIQKKY